MKNSKSDISVVEMSKKELFNNNIEKPSAPYITKSQTSLTKQEIERRAFIERELGQLGISTSVFDSSNSGKEDEDILKAIILVNEGKTIPEELKARIISKQKEKQTVFSFSDE